MTNAHVTKDIKQRQALRAWIDHNHRGLVAGATGVGKSRIGILAVVEHYNMFPQRVLLVVPTVELRDVDWKAEAQTWGAGEIWQEVKEICYDSLHKEDLLAYDLIIFDEFHHLTMNMWNASGLGSYKAAVLMLSATPPHPTREKTKYQMMMMLGGVIFSLPLDQAVGLGLVRDYRIYVIETDLYTVKNIPAGSKKKPFLTSERGQYEYLERTITSMQIELGADLPDATDEELEKLDKRLFMMTMKRNQFLYNLQSKTDMAKVIVPHLAAQGRTLVFCGSIAQAEAVGGDFTYHSKRDDSALVAFRNKEIPMLAAVNALNEGVNIPELRFGYLAQVDRNERALTQRIGRIIRLGIEGIAEIFVSVAKGTADERWFKAASSSFDQSKISYLSGKNFVK